MKQVSLIIASVAAPALVSCGSQTSDNLSANTQAIENAVLENVAADAANVAAEAPAIEPTAVPKPKQAERRPDREPAPRPKTIVDPPPVDPHAGHDMGNMANMQH